MRTVIVAAVFAFAAAGYASADPAGDALNAKADDCIRTNAAEVAAKSATMGGAVTFLVTDLCVMDIHHAQAHAASEKTLTEWRATMSATQLAGVSIDAATGELQTPPNFQPGLGVANMVMLEAMRGPNAASEFTASAARAVLAARKPIESH